jgi:type I restriction enzyme S subunit
MRFGKGWGRSGMISNITCYNSDWDMMSLDEFGDFDRGKSRHRPRDDKSLFGGRYPFVQTGDIKSSNMRVLKYSSTYNDKGLSQSKLWEKGTLCITIAANIAETAILGIDACFPDSVVGFVPRENEVDSFFMHYLFCYLKNEIQHSAIGSVQDNINLAYLNKLRFRVPKLAERMELSHTLMVLDNKVELNNRINKTLEEMAQAIFKSWFIDFEPFQDGEFEDSELGRIPKGWRVSSLRDNVKISTKSIDPCKYESLLFEHFSIPAYDEGNVPIFQNSSEIKSNKFCVPESCFLVSKLNPMTKRIWKPFCTSKNAICSTEFIVYVDINPIFTYFHFLLVNDCAFYDFFVSNATGSTNSRQRVIPSTTLKYRYVLPTEETARNFSNIVKPIYEKTQNNKQENLKLTILRNVLLPKLMNGEIRVPFQKEMGQRDGLVVHQ